MRQFVLNGLPHQGKVFLLGVQTGMLNDQKQGLVGLRAYFIGAYPAVLSQDSRYLYQIDTIHLRHFPPQFLHFHGLKTILFFYLANLFSELLVIFQYLKQPDLQWFVQIGFHPVQFLLHCRNKFLPLGRIVQGV